MGEFPVLLTPGGEVLGLRTAVCCFRGETLTLRWRWPESFTGERGFGHGGFMYAVFDEMGCHLLRLLYPERRDPVTLEGRIAHSATLRPGASVTMTLVMSDRSACMLRGSLLQSGKLVATYEGKWHLGTPKGR